LFVVDTSGSMRGEPLNALKTTMINTIQYINDDNYIGILDELLDILNDK
jgi:Ca-activated chloride channel family protein